MHKVFAHEHQHAVHNPDSLEVRESYKAFVAETITQYRHIAASLTISFIDDINVISYANSDELRCDIDRGCLKLLLTVDSLPIGHLLNAPTDIIVNGVYLCANDVFRIVHDVVAHGLNGCSFSLRGETEGFRAHRKFYSPTALPALCAETLMQNSWFNVIGGGDYAPQKCYIPSLHAQNF